MQDGILVLLKNHMMWTQEDPRIEGWLPWHYQSGPGLVLPSEIVWLLVISR
jgi:hypothetical protein